MKVTVVETNRAAKYNAYHEPMWLELGQIFNKLSHDSDVRAVVFTAAGDKAFSAGLDVQAASQGGILGGEETKLDIARQGVALRRHIREFQDCVSAIESCEKRKKNALKTRATLTGIFSCHCGCAWNLLRPRY